MSILKKRKLNTSDTVAPPKVKTVKGEHPAKTKKPAKPAPPPAPESSEDEEEEEEAPLESKNEEFTEGDATPKADEVKKTFADLGQTVAEVFDVGPLDHGTSFLSEIQRI